MWTYARHPHTLRCETSGFSLSHSSYGVLPLSADVGQQLQTWMSARRASTHNCIGKFASESIAVMRSPITLFPFSAVPFCCGLLHTVCLRTIPFLSQ